MPNHRSLDEIREQHPYLGLALYALDPAGPVVLEVHADGQVYTFTGSSESAVIAAAFPPAPPVSIFD